MPWENYIECADGQCAGAIFLDNGQGAVLGANFMRGNDVVFDLERQRVGFAPADCAYTEPPAGAGAAVVPAAGAAAAAEPEAAAEEDKDCELAFGAEAGPCDAVCPAGQDGVASGEQPFEMAIAAPATGKGKACPALPLVQKKPCLVTCHADADAAAAAAVGEESGGGEPCPAEVTWSACSAACTQEGKAQAKQADGTCGPVAVSRPCAVGADCAAALEGYAVDVLLLLIGLPSGDKKDRTLSRALQVRVDSYTHL
jgi:hypothetical protein